MTTSKSPSYDELKQRMEAAESALKTIRNGRVGNILGENGTLVERLAEAEAREAHLKKVLLGIRNVNQLIVAEADPRRLIEQACVNLTETMGYHNAWLALPGGETARGLGLPAEGPLAAAAAAGFNGGFEALREHLERGNFPDCMAHALESNDTLVKADPATDCPDCPLHGQYGGSAGLARRLEAGGVTYGILAASVPAAYARDDEEQDLFNEVAGDLAFALYKIAAARKLEDAHRRYRDLFEKHSAAKLIIDPEDGRIVDANAAAVEFYGWNRDKLCRMSISDINTLTPAQVKTEMENAQSLKRTHFEFRHRRADGSVRDVAVYSSNVEADGKELLYSIIHDITDRKQAEEKLGAAEETYRNVFLNAQIGMFRTDIKSGLILDANDVVARFTGYRDREEMLAAPFRIAERYVNPGDRKKMTALLEADGEVTDFEAPFRRNDGSTIIMRFSARLVPEKGWIEGVSVDVTRERQAEEALKRQHAMLARTEALAHVGSWEWEAEGDKVTWSEELFRIFGRDPDTDAPSFAQHPEIYLPDDMERLRKAVERCVSQGTPYELDLRAIRSDGEIRHCVARGQAETDETGRVVRLAGSLQDRTEEKQQTERIAILGRMLDEAPALITIHDTGGRFLYANQKTVAIHGYAGLDEFLKINLHELDVPESEALLAERFRKIDEEGEARFDVAHFKKDGSTFPLEVLAKQIEWEGRPAVLSIATDITERKMIEQELRRREELLNQAQEIAQLGSYVWSIGDDRLEWSRQMFAIAGIDPDRFYENLQETVLNLIHPDDREGVNEQVRKMLEQKRTWPMEFRLVRPDGGVRWLRSTSRFEYDGRGDPVLCVGVHHDITEKKQSEAEYEKLQTQLRQAQKMEAVGRLAGGVAHDFNNMLGIIIGHADMILEEMNPDQPFYGDLTEIRKAGERSADLTRQLLAFARKQTVSPKEIDLNNTVEGMLKMLHRLIGEDIDMAWIPGEKIWLVKIDPGQVDQILANLCVNSRDAIADVGKVTIETGNIVFDDDYCKVHAGFAPGEYVMLAVSDNGCGMDSETLSHLFEPFFTTKELGKGTGLGLATVYGVVKQNNGFINVYSEPGQGTTFRIYLPRHRSKKVSLPDKKTDQPGRRGRETVLLVEDEPAILRMTTMMLEREGYTVVGAGTPGEAVRLATEHAGDIHLLITDVVMPEMNGRDLAKNILSLYPLLKCLFMSGYTANVIAHHGVLDEGVNFIQKPFSKKDLAVKVREALESAG